MGKYYVNINCACGANIKGHYKNGKTHVCICGLLFVPLLKKT